MRTLFTFLFGFCLLVLLPTPSQAANKVLRVSFNTLPPWKIINENEHHTGIDIEFLRLFAKRLNLDLEFIDLPFKRGLKTLANGEIDIMIGVLRRAEREQFAHFLMPPYKTGTHKAFYVRKGNEHTITKHEDLHGLIIGTQLGGKYYPSFDADIAIEKAVVTDTELNAKMLLAGRIDAFITTEAVGDYRLNRGGLTNRIAKAHYVYNKQQNVHIVLSRLSLFTPRLDEFNHVLSELIAEGEFERIKKEFLEHQAIQITE